MCRLGLSLFIATLGFSACDGDVSMSAGPDASGPSDGATPRADGALPDGGVLPGSDSGPPPPPPEGPARYSEDRTQSPITPFVAARLNEIAASAAESDDVFAKIGDSITVASSFMHCFASSRVDLDGRVALQESVDHFGAGDAAGTSPFERDSVSAVGGWPAFRALEGSPSPLDTEVGAIAPRFAVVMYGTNDIGYDNLPRYGENMLDIADRLIARGVIPILSSIPPRDDSASADAQVPFYNAVVRAVAETRQVPFVDFHRELVPLPDHGLSGDGVHPSTYVDGGSLAACILTRDGLQHGYNVRNLVTLEALDRARRVVVAGEEAPDPPAAPIDGDGSPERPFVVPALPFSHARDTTSSATRAIDTYTGCAATQDESGPEIVYELDIAAPTRVHAMVFDRGGTDVDVHLLGATGGGEACIARNDWHVVQDLDPGTWRLVLDTFVSSGMERPGEYLLVIVAEP